MTVAVTPGTATLVGGQTQQFTAVVTNTNYTNVTWTVVSGGGSISVAGVYTAPAVTALATVTVRATSVADATKFATATVTVNPTAAVTVAVTPGTATLYGGQSQQFTATVTNAANAAVTWGVTGAGTVNAAGLYTAPASVAAQTTATVTATSVADGTKSASAVMTLSPAVSVTVTPATAVLYGGQTQQFAAGVANAANTAVTWSVSGGGSISTAGLYTAPATVSAVTPVTVTATSVADVS